MSDKIAGIVGLGIMGGAIAKNLGAAESGSFVNGVLHKISQSVRPKGSSSHSPAATPVESEGEDA